MKKVKKELIAQKLDLVIQKLINLDNPENEDKLKEVYDIEIGKDYPRVIVDHSESRKHVMDKFKHI